MNNTDTTRSILLVDDSSTNTLLLESALKKLNLNISTAYSGEEALSLFNKKNFDLVLLDIMMPGMSGYDVLSAIKSGEKNADCPIIMVTASARSEEETKAMALGAADYFEKPLDLDKVLSKVQELV